MSPLLPRCLSLIGLVLLASAVRAQNKTAPIRDDAQLFHPDAIAHAEQGIAEIQRDYDCNLLIRTVNSTAPGHHHWFPFLRTPEVNRKLEAQAREYASESGVEGIYVVIFTRPRTVHVIVWPEDKPEFTRRDAEALRRMLTHRLHTRDADPALLALVDQVHTVLGDHVARGSSPVVNDVVLAGLLVGGLGLWLLLRMIRYRMRARRGVSGWQEGSEIDPSIQTRATAALLGTRFGFPAGMWVYDKLYPCPPGATPLCPPPAEEEEKAAQRDEEPHPSPEHAQDAPVSP